MTGMLINVEEEDRGVALSVNKPAINISAAVTVTVKTEILKLRKI